MMLLYLLFVLLSISRPCLSQTDAEDAARIDTFVRDIMVSEDMIGMAVAVVKDGRPLMAEGYGVKHMTELGDVTNETLWYLASCSKAINAALVTKILAEDGRYTVDSPVREIWPEFTLGTGFRSEHLTIRDLLAHRAGIPDSLMGILAGVYTSRQDYISRARFFPTMRPIRTGESYNNLMVTIAGYIAGLLNGGTWEQAVDQHLLTPLGMDQTIPVGDLTPEMYPQVAISHDDYQGSPRPISMDVFGDNLVPAAPSGGIFTNAVDMQKWLLFLTNKGLAGDSSPVMNESDIMRTMTESSLARHMPIPETPSEPLVDLITGVALGWYSGIYRGYIQAFHGGYLFGYQSQVTVLPDRGLAISVNINCNDGYVNGSVMSRVHAFALDTMLGLDPDPAITITKETTSSDRVLLGKPRNWENEQIQNDNIEHGGAKANAQYAGTYGNFIFGNLTVVYNNTSGSLDGTWGSLGAMTLIPLGNDTFLGATHDPLWFAPPIPISFESTDGQVYDRMYIPFLFPEAPPVFIRDLLMSDAPPPPTDDCEAPLT